MRVSVALKKDHDALRALMKDLKSNEISHTRKQKILTSFEELLESHTSAEESAIYTKAKKLRGLRPHVLEGLEEHRLCERFEYKIAHTRNHENWIAKVKVLCDTLKHHLKEEEQDLFPVLEKSLSAEESHDLCLEYLEARSKTQRKPTKNNRGALELDPSRSRVSSWIAGSPLAQVFGSNAL